MAQATVTRSGVEHLLELAKDMTRSGKAARVVIERRLSREEHETLDWVEGELERDANMLRDPGWQLMLAIAEEAWPDLLKRLRNPEDFADASYPLLVHEVGELLRHKRRDKYPSDTTLRRFAVAVDAPRLGPGNYRVFFARHVLFAAFLATGAGENEVADTRRHGQLRWTPREAAILLTAPEVHRAIRSQVEALAREALGSDLHSERDDSDDEIAANAYQYGAPREVALARARNRH